uniref:Uncharacterized protein n=1 Tax=Plectus sambesii TaxID=2011161 RepID=A0A914X1E1_9BILA
MSTPHNRSASLYRHLLPNNSAAVLPVIHVADDEPQLLPAIEQLMASSPPPLSPVSSQQGFMLIGQVSVGSYDTALLFVLAVFVLNVLVALAAFCYFSPEMNPMCGRRMQSRMTKNRATSEVLMRETVLDETSDQADIF